MNKFGRVNSIYSYNKFKGGAYAAFFPLPEWFEREKHNGEKYT
jgi:hypothetical protein